MSKLFFVVYLLVNLSLGNSEFHFDKVRDVIVKNGEATSAAMMIDASAKSIPNGILKGNFYNLGSYDACLAIHDGVQGKYCYATLSIMEIISILQEQNQKHLSVFEDIGKKKKILERKLEVRADDGSTYGFHFGFCVPDKLSATFLNEHVPGLVFDDDFCYANDRKLETKHWIALGVIGIFIVLAMLSTIYDVTSCCLGRETHKSISAFSIYTNGKQLLKSTKNENHLLCLDGLRTLNMLWVIIGHVYVNFLLSGAIDNWNDAFDWMNSASNMGIIGGTISVDSFFTIAGLLTVYIFMRSPEDDVKENFKSVPLMYLHRYLRLTPALAILVMVYATGLINFVGNGPRWGWMQQLAVQDCEESWWTTLLYFQNYYTKHNLCVAQSWYLSVDMQLFILSPFILIPLKKWPKYVLPLMVALVGAGVAIPFYIGYSNKFTGLVMGSTTATFNNEYYYKTHARFGPYVIGMLAGYLIHKIRSGGRKLRLNKVILSILWILTIGAFIGCVYDGHELVKDETSALWDGMYVGFNRSIWSCALSLLVILCVTGNGGIINTFLSLPIMQFLSKLSYTMYLVHYIIITAVNLSLRDTMHFSEFNAIFHFFSIYILTILVSVVYTLLFESPIIILEKLLFSKIRT